MKMKINAKNRNQANEHVSQKKNRIESREVKVFVGFFFFLLQYYDYHHYSYDFFL